MKRNKHIFPEELQKLFNARSNRHYDKIIEEYRQRDTAIDRMFAADRSQPLSYTYDLLDPRVADILLNCTTKGEELLIFCFGSRYAGNGKHLRKFAQIKLLRQHALG